MDQQNKPLEIERKYLIRYPDMSLIQNIPNVNVSHITQIYLSVDQKHISERIRKREFSDKIRYTHTIKRRITPLTCIEEEVEITEAEYLALQEKADSKRNPVYKDRFCIPYDGLTFELDIYPFWQDRAILEVELSSEAQIVMIPKYFTLIKEVTDDVRYKNKSLAREVPMENLL